LHDSVGLKSFKLSGRDLPARSEFQFVEAEYMMADEYDALIADPVKFVFDRWLPRILGECKERGSIRSYMALLKGGRAYAQFGEIMRKRTIASQQ
jgi:hypothetical protein